MTTEERIVNETKDQFPSGIRVLAVDNDPSSLSLLETLLRRCQYNVTTATDAITALKLLKENNNLLDLVIIDVDMPGFKFLDLVAVQMELPVIMSSANCDSKLVMEGIAHGACDYLLKPVRIEDLKKIWQHVVRRKKFGRYNSYGQVKPRADSGEAARRGNVDHEDSSTQRKPPFVWSAERHRKFIAAINQLGGIEKAIPEKILGLMNDENLTRENVASHLQKFKLFLRKLGPVGNQQANMDLYTDLSRLWWSPNGLVQNSLTYKIKMHRSSVPGNHNENTSCNLSSIAHACNYWCTRTNLWLQDIFDLFFSCH